MERYDVRIGRDAIGSNIAVGRGARAGDITGNQQVTQLLDDLIAMLERYGDQDPRMRDILSLAKSARDESTAGKPDKSRIRSLLAGAGALIATMGTAVAGVADLAAAVDNIRMAVGG